MYLTPAKMKLMRPLWKFRTTARQAQENGATLSADQLQRCYLSAILNYVAGRIPRGDAAEVEDITAEVFAAAFAKLPRAPSLGAVPVSSDHDPTRAWLFGIARRKVADFYRRRERQPQTALSENHPVPDPQNPEPQYLAGEATQTLHALLDSLPDEQREAIHLRYIDELSTSEIGHILGKSPNATAQLLHRARQTLRVRGAAYFGNDFATEE